METRIPPSIVALFVSFNLIAIASTEIHLNTSKKLLIGELNLGQSKDSPLGVAPRSPTIGGASLVLASSRTNRPDIINRFARYRGGWNFTDPHYWSSVSFTGASGFILAAAWFTSFGLALLARHCCCRRRTAKYGHKSALTQKIHLILLVLFTFSVAAGCVLLSIGQYSFHQQSIHTLDYAVNQSEFTVETLRNVTQYLSLAKTINVAQFFLPADALNQIDKLNTDLDSAADTLSLKTHQNSAKIMKVFDAVTKSLIALAAFVLFFSILGLILSILRHKIIVQIFVLTGWVLVTVTFILLGALLILNNAISDTCMAMDEWVGNPDATSALSSILPCVDVATTNQTLYQSKRIVNDIVNVVNTYIYTYANTDKRPNEFGYYNQSGPLVPPLCYPFDDSDLTERRCGSGETRMEDASAVWREYVCEASARGICVTAGRIPPTIYRQVAVAMNESHALEHYAPVLLSLQDCKFVRETFREITRVYGPPLARGLRVLIGGFVLVSVSVLLCLVMWVVYSNRPLREDAFAKGSNPDTDTVNNI